MAEKGCDEGWVDKVVNGLLEGHTMDVMCTQLARAWLRAGDDAYG